MNIENEEKSEMVSLTEKVGKLQNSIKLLVVVLAVILLLNGATLYIQIAQVSSVSEDLGQLSVRIDDLIMNIGNLTDNTIGTTIEIGNVKQDVSTMINMFRDAEIAARQFDKSALGLKSPLGVQFSCVDDSTNQAIEPCPVNVKILEITLIDEFVLDSGKIMKTVPEKIRLSVSVNIPGYAVYSNIFEYTENGQSYPVEVRLIKQ